MLAAHVLTGLLASQDPEKGWPFDTLSVMSLRIADNLLQFDAMQELPELKKSEPQTEAPSNENAEPRETK